MTPDKANSLANDISHVIATLQAIACELMTAYPDSGCCRDEPEQKDVAIPEPKPLTLEEVRAVLAEKSRSSHTAAVREIILRHGVDKLSAVSPGEYPALLKEAEALGKMGDEYNG